MSATLVTNSNYGRRRLYSDSFTLQGAGAPIPTPNATERHAESYTLIDDGAGVLGFRVKMRAGQILYDMTIPTTSITVGIKNDDSTGHVASATRIVDTVGPGGLPLANEFDIVVRTVAGAVVQTANLEVSWTVVVLDRG